MTKDTQQPEQTQEVDQTAEQPKRGETSVLQHIDEAGYSKVDDPIDTEDQQSDALPEVAEGSQDEPIAEDPSTARKAVLATLPANVQSAFGEIERYKINMDPRRGQTRETLKQSQSSFVNAISTILYYSKEHFETAWNLLVDDFRNDPTGAFRPENVHRQWANVPVTVDQIKLHQQLVHVLTLTAGMKNRSMVSRQVSFTGLLKLITDESVRQRVILYYQLS